MPGVPSLVLVPKQVCLVHDLGLLKKKKKKPMYLVEYLRKNTTIKVLGQGPTTKICRDHGPGLDLGKKRGRKKKAEYTLRTDPRIIIKKNNLK